MRIKANVKNYQKIYRKVLEKANIDDINNRSNAYALHLSEMYASDNFKKHDIYPSTSTPHVYAVIAMCLELKELGLPDTEIMDYINYGFNARRTFFNVIIAMITYTDYGLFLWMLTGAVLCAMFAGLIFVTFKREE